MWARVFPKWVLRILSGAGLLVLWCFLRISPAQAQVVGATITGTVRDASGAVIPNVQVSITNVATGVAREVTSDSAGFYTAPNLLPGNYTVRATAPGFTTEVHSGVTLAVGAQQVLDITMQVGQVSQTVEVTAKAPVVQLASSALSWQVTATTVRELPLNGRSWTDLAILQPGVSQIETHAAEGNRGYGGQVAISGARPQQNNYRLDGISINDYSNGGPGSVLGGNLGVDAIQEFSVLTSNYSAEYGKTSGGVVNAITRSGTNSFHGSAYEFLRNSALDARNFFDKATVPPFRRNQFGASLGGPIVKDRTFFFGDYEGIRQSLTTTQVDTVPSLAARAGNLSTGTVRVDPFVQRFLALYPLPNGPTLGAGDVAEFTFPRDQITSENYFTIHIDQKFSPQDSMFVTYVYDNTPSTDPDTFNNILISTLTKRQFVILEEDHTFGSSFINAVRVGYNRDRVDSSLQLSAINPAAADTSLGGLPGLTAPNVSVPGFSLFRGGLNGAGWGVRRWNSYQAYDDAFYTRGTHSIKFGVSFEREQDNQIGHTQPTGEYHFRTIADFLTNKPQRLSSTLPGFQFPSDMRQSVVGVYIQDDWRARPNLTLNLGLRYEMATVPTEAHGRLTNAYNLTDSTPHLGNPYFYNPTLRNFEPRLGFAWDPFGTGKTAVRGGFGIVDGLPLPYMYVSLTGLAYPYSELGSVSNIKNSAGVCISLCQGSFVAGGFPQLQGGKFLFASIEPHPKRNYVMQYSFNIQHELTPNLSALVGYVGSRGVHQPFRTDDADMVLPVKTSAGYLWPNPVGSGTILNPNASAIRFLNWRGSSFFNALEVGLTRRMSHGLQLQGSFTWSKSIDNDSGVIAGDTLANAFPSPDWFDLRVTRALSDYNVGRTFVLSGTWDIPVGKSLTGPAALIRNGWELGAIFKANDGVPITPTFGTDGDPLGKNSSDPWDFPNRIMGSGCETLSNPGNPNNYFKTQCFAVPTAPTPQFYAANCDPSFGTYPQCFNLRGNAGRNIIIGPGLVNLDFSVFKNFPVKSLSEAFNIQFRAEVFNILNRANFDVPVVPDNTDIFNSTGAPTGVAGLLTSTVTPSRQIQFALKVVW
jgi:hypothetical protein